MSDKDFPEVSKILKARSYYEVLDLDEKCTSDEVKRGYKKMAMKVHPDRCKHPKATEAFQKISHVYQVLSDDQKRADYDKYGENKPQQQQQTYQQQHFYRNNVFNGGTYYTFDDEMSPEDIFNMFFGMNTGFHNINPGFPDMNFRRQRQYRRAPEEDVPLYRRPQFIQTLLTIIPLILISFLNYGGSTQDEWSNHVVFGTDDSNKYLILSSEKYKKSFGISKEWLRAQNARGPLGNDFYRNIKKKADELYVTRLRDKCNDEKRSHSFNPPSCEKLRKLRSK